MRVIWIWLFVCLGMQGCSLTKRTDDQLMLPSHKTLRCCWQAQQQLTIVHGEKRTQVTLVIANTLDRLLVVGLNSLGQRVFTFTQKETNVETNYFGEKPNEALPVKKLLLAIYLDELDEGDWQVNANLSATKQADKALLSEQGTPIIEITRRRSGAKKVKYLQEKIEVEVQEISRQTL